MKKSALKSRKFWVVVGAAVANIVLPMTGVGAAALPAINKLASYYLGTEGLIDAAHAAASKGE